MSKPLTTALLSKDAAPTVPLVRADLHTHTWHSLDSWMAPATLVERARAGGLDRVAVTDHGEIDGALEAHALDPARVIVGQEICCEGDTEIIGLFLHRRVPMGRPLEESAADVRDQGGLVYAPHPFAYRSHWRWHAERALAVADIVEVFNSRAFLPYWDRAASRAAREKGLPGAAGSDAHFPWEIGRACTILPAFDDAAGFRSALALAVPVGMHKALATIHVASVTLETMRRVARFLAGATIRRSYGGATLEDGLDAG
ncbi:MAG: PHP domain-containing protein [Gemmatimonadetes bacterium]|nr:PHP domain-containing protein [Gemmatimonadota bacterium]